MAGSTNDTGALINSVVKLFPQCDFQEHSFDKGGCIENLDSNKGFVYYEDFERCQGSWILLPGFHLLPRWFLGVTYFLWLMWLFFGIAVISDVFVESIEVITSLQKTVKRKNSKGEDIMVQVPVWNWVVANITLMAVGTSSPEILLAVVETMMTLGKPTQSLGPSCIIGSASYNLFGISAVCTIAIANGQFKRIQHVKVFIWTTAWSLFANLWLWIVYAKISPNEIEMWEGFLTLGFMPVFVWTSYLVDIRGWNWFKRPNEIWPDDVEVSKGTDDSPEGKVLEDHERMQRQHHSILYYRHMAATQMKGGNVSDSFKERAGAHQLLSKPAAVFDIESIPKMDKTSQKVMFKSPQYACLESKGVATVEVLRLHGDMSEVVHVQYKTQDASAVAGLDYMEQEGTLTFAPGETVKEIGIKIIDDDMSEPDVMFQVLLLDARSASGKAVKLLQTSVDVTIVDDDDGGILTFELPSVEAGTKDDAVDVTVVRRSGSDGKVTVNWSTKGGTAQPGVHFHEAKGTLVFESRELKKTISIALIPQPDVDPNASLVNFGAKAFKVQLSGVTGGAALGARQECRVLLVEGNRAAKGGSGGKGGDDGDGEFDLWAAWGERFQEAAIPTLQEEDKEDKGALFLTCALHYVSITWKLLAAFCPPPEWKGGYPCFFATLAFLGALMAITNQVANLLGCAMGLSEVMTGISIVAMGTSLPDTFASRMAAINDDTADAAIGNIMGSNACNVFLGLGIPWVIATSYYAARDEPYLTPAGSLGFSVIIFFILAILGIGLLVFRRFQGGELGGSSTAQWYCFSILISLWLIFLVLAGMYDYGNIPETDAL